MLGLALIWQLISIAPYTSVYPKQMSNSRANNNSNRISLLIYNVLYDNAKVEALRDLIRQTNPDLILLSEPTGRWLDQLSCLEGDYPYTLFQPQDHHYGKLLYSRMELVNPKIRFMIEPGDSADEEPRPDAGDEEEEEAEEAIDKGNSNN